MATAILLFNGLHYPVSMIDKATVWASGNGGNITALFLLSDKNQEEGYPFPNDLEETEESYTDAEALGNDLAIIASNIRLMRHEARNAKVELTTRLLPAPSVAEIHRMLQTARQIFITEQPIDPSLLSVDVAKIKAALTDLTATIEWVKE